jgi:hypothetical protein
MRAAPRSSDVCITLVPKSAFCSSLVFRLLLLLGLDHPTQLGGPTFTPSERLSESSTTCTAGRLRRMASLVVAAADHVS